MPRRRTARRPGGASDPRAAARPGRGGATRTGTPARARATRPRRRRIPAPGSTWRSYGHHNRRGDMIPSRVIPDCLDRQHQLVHAAAAVTILLGLVFVFVRAPHPFGWEGIDHYDDLARRLAARRAISDDRRAVGLRVLPRVLLSVGRRPRLDSAHRAGAAERTRPVAALLRGAAGPRGPRRHAGGAARLGAVLQHGVRVDAVLGFGLHRDFSGEPRCIRRRDPFCVAAAVRGKRAARRPRVAVQAQSDPAASRPRGDCTGEDRTLDAARAGARDSISRLPGRCPFHG